MVCERLFLNHHRNDVVKTLVADDDAAGVLAELANHTLQNLALLENVLYLGVGLDFVAQLRRHIARLLERHFQLVGNELCKGVAALV